MNEGMEVLRQGTWTLDESSGEMHIHFEIEV